ncbi:hypothetical protein HanIR_Chr03g0105941 [Helianthus annuus]|nr:hypothetical protein HanIR_Chr03g0105941 [Helianthus annuus]
MHYKYTLVDFITCSLFGTSKRCMLRERDKKFNFMHTIGCALLIHIHLNKIDKTLI